MPRRYVPFQLNCIYHLYNRGNHKEPIFFEEENYRYFVRLMQKYLESEAVAILAYCLMKNHYHLLIEIRGKVDLSLKMKNLSIAYTKAINKRYDKGGHLFQGQFQGKQVDTVEYLLTLTRYIHNNPVKAHLVPSNEEWKYSSYQDYLGLRTAGIVSTESVMKYFKNIDEFLRFSEGSDSATEDLMEQNQQDFRRH